MENHSNGYNGTSTNGHLYSPEQDRSSKSGNVMWQSDSGSAFLRAARSGHMDKVVSFMENGTDINTCNQNGLNALHLSSKEGHVDVVRELLTRGAAVDSVTRKGNAAIHVASLAGQDEVVQLLIQAGTNVNLQSQNGFTPLYMAAQEGHDKVVRNLLQHGANQSITTEDGFTPLAVALQQGHDNVVSVLLEHDCRGKVRLPALHIAAKKDDCKAALLLLQNEQKVDVTSRSGFTPLHIAAHYDNRNMALLLIDRGANVNYEAKHQITPLHVAAKWGRGGMVDLLCARGCVLESRTRDGLTPLHCAARSGHESVIELLLLKGAAISAKTKNGLTPLHMAAQGDHVDSARMLLFHHAPIDDITVDYLTALHVAAHCGHVRVAKLLMERQADASARALNGFTPLHIACKKNRLEVVQLLLKQGADLEATTESGLTPLHVASFMGCMDIVICLLQHKARVDHPTIRGETPLHLAARSNQTDIIRILLKNRAQVDSPAREEQTALHIATRLGNIDTVQLLLQYKAGVNLTTKDSYTPLHIAAKEDQHEVAEVLLNAGASLSAVNSSGFTPLHVSAKYDSVQVAALLIPRGADVNATGKYDVTPLHVAVHYNSHKVALLLLESKASVNVTAKNGFTPLHIAPKNNQIESVTALLEYGADCNSMSQGGYSPLHLAALHAHTDLATLLLAHGARATVVAPGSALTPLHLAAERGEPAMASLLLQHGADTRATSAAGFTPLHVAAHHGHAALVRLLLQHSAEVNPVTTAGYTPLHQAAQQGHTLVINLLLQHRATPEATTNSGQTALSIAERLGYVSVVETLKVVTETTTTTTVSGQLQEIYHVPETMHETFLTDSEDETDAGYLDSAVFGNPSHAKHVILPYYEAKLDMEEPSVTDTSYKYLTVDEMKSLGDESMPMDTSRDETLDRSRELSAELLTVSPSVDELMTSHTRVNDLSQTDSPRPRSLRLDNVDIDRSPVTAGFLVSFMVDARGGAMRGCRHSGVRVIVPPRKAAEPMRITCRYLKKDKLLHPPPLVEGEALASRILEMGPSQAKFLGPVILEVPHFASLRGRQREIVVLRCDDGATWREHRLETSQQAVQEVLNESFDGAELKQLEDLNTDRITRILTTDFPQYFAIISRLRQEVHAVGPEGGTISSTVVPQVQAVFPAGALTKKIRVGLQAQPLSAELVTGFLGAGITVSPIVTIEPRRRKFHKPITLTIPLPQKKRAGVISSTSGNTPSLRLLCSITGGNSAAQWEDVSGSTPLTYISDCVSFTSTVSARFWLIDCRGLPDTPRLATQLYQRANLVPFMAKFVVFAKRVSADRGRLRVFCMTDDREDKTLEHQEHFHEVAKSRDVEVLDGGWVCLECDGNLSCDALAPGSSTGAVNGGCSGRPALKFSAFRENRCSVYVRVVDLSQEPSARLIFTSQEQNEKHSLISTLGVCLPTEVCPLLDISGADSLSRVTSPSVLDNTNDDIPDNLELESGGGGVHSHDTAQRGDENGADEGVDDSSAMNDVQLRHKRHGDDTDAVGKLVNPEIHRAEIRVTDIARALGDDWRALAHRLDIGRSDIELISSEYADDPEQKATVMLRLWMANAGLDATGNVLAESLSDIGREDIISSCCVNVTMVTNAMEATIAKQRLSQADGFHVAEQKQHDSPHVQRADSEDDDTTPTNTTAVEIEGRHVSDSRVNAERESAARVIITPRLSPATGVVTVVPGDGSVAEQTVSATETAGGQRQSAEDRLSLLQQLGEALDKAEEKIPPTDKQSEVVLSEVDGVEPVLESGLREPGQSPVTSIITISNTQSPSTERESAARVIITPRLSPATGVVTVVPGDESGAEQTVSATETAGGQRQSAEDRLNLLHQLGEALDKAEEKTQPTAKQSEVVLSEVDGVEPVLESGLREPGQSPVTSIITISNTQSPSTERGSGARVIITPRLSPATGVVTVVPGDESVAEQTVSATETAAGQRQSAEDRLNLLQQLGEALDKAEEKTPPTAKQSTVILSEVDEVEPVLESGLREPGQSPVTSIITISNTQSPSTVNQECPGRTPPPSPAHTSNDPLQSTSLDPNSLTESRQSLPSEGDLQSSEMTLTSSKSDGACDPGDEFFPAPSVSPVGSIEQGCCPDSSACQDTTCPVSDSSVAPSVDCLLDPECISDTADAERYFRVHADIVERSGLDDEMLISVDSLDCAVARDTGVVVLQSEYDSPVVVVDSLDSSVARGTGLVVLEDEFDSPVVVVDSLDSLETDLVVLENVAATDPPGNHFHLCVSMNTDQCDEDGVYKTEYQPSTIDPQAEENTDIGEKSFTKPYSTETPFPPSEPHPEEEPHPTGEALSPSGQHPMEIFSPSEPHSIEESHPTEEALPPLEPDPTEKPLSPSEQHPMESFSPSEPHSKEEPHPTEEPLSISERHSAEEPLSISEPRPPEEPLPKSEPHPTEEPLSVVESHPTEEPLSVVEPHPTEEPLSVVEPYPTEKPLSVSEPHPTEEPLSISEPNPTEEPLSISELPRSEEPLSMSVQHPTEEPLSVSEPHPTEESFSVVEPHPTEESFSVVEPHPTEEPLSVVEPYPTDEPFSVVEPHPTEEPHSTEEPLSVVGPHSTEESLSLSEPYPTEEPLSVSEPYSPEEPRSISEQHPTEEPLSVSEPPPISEPYPTEEPLTVVGPHSTEEPLSGSEPYPTEEPPSVSEPLSISEPHSPEEPRSISEAHSTEEPPSLSEPHPTEEPLLVSEPHSTEEPLSVVEPYPTEEPLSVVEPLSVSEPYPTEKPFSVVEPHPTEEPRSVSELHSTEEPPSELHPLAEPLSPSELNQTEELFSTIESEPTPVEGALPSALKEETGARVRAARHVTFDLPSEVSEESEESAVSMETGLVLCDSSPVVVRGRTLLQKPHTLHRQQATNLDTAHGHSRTGSSPALVETTAVVSLMPCFAEFCSSSVEEFADVVQLSSSSSECYSGRRSPLDSTSTSSHHVCTARASSVLVPPPSQFLSDSDQSSRCLCTLDEDCESESEESSAIYCSLLTDSERVLLEPAPDSESALLTDSEREVLVDSECEVMEPVEDYERAVLEPVSEHYGRAELGHRTEWSTNADCSVSLSSSSGRSEDLASALCLNSHASGQMTSADVPDLEFDFSCNMAVPSADFRLRVPSPSVTRRAYSYEPMRELKRDSAISRLLSDPGSGVHLDNTTGGDERAASQSMLPHGLGSSVEDPALNKHDARDS